MRIRMTGFVAVCLSAALVAVGLAGSAERARTSGSVTAGLPVFGPEDPEIAGLPRLSEPPIRWVPPATFNADTPGLGLPMAPGVEHSIIYDPSPSRANINEGGTGQYESPLHGTFNHHPSWFFVGNHVLTQWTNHSIDENGPGQRIIARIGRLIDGDSPNARIDWGRPEETVVEIAPPPVPVRKRYWYVDPDTIHPHIEGGFSVNENGEIWVGAHLTCIGGYTTKEANRRPRGPLPAAEFSDSASRALGFRFDLWINLGMSYIQRWKIVNDRLVPDSPMYMLTPPLERVEVTPGRWKVVAPLQPPYTTMMPLAQAPPEIRNRYTPRTGAAPPPPRTREQDEPEYPRGANWLAADGKHALAHNTAYTRSDGKIVTIRDNLLSPGTYYASIRDPDGQFPPAMKTNLYGSAAPKANNLPDGRVSILCNSRRRHDMFMVLSRDGIVFDKTWNIFHAERQASGIYTGGGPQYFMPKVVGPNMWIFYSIGKVQMGVTKVPLANL